METFPHLNPLLLPTSLGLLNSPQVPHCRIVEWGWHARLFLPAQIKRIWRIFLILASKVKWWIFLSNIRPFEPSLPLIASHLSLFNSFLSTQCILLCSYLFPSTYISSSHIYSLPLICFPCHSYLFPPTHISFLTLLSLSSHSYLFPHTPISFLSLISFSSPSYLFPPTHISLISLPSHSYLFPLPHIFSFPLVALCFSTYPLTRLWQPNLDLLGLNPLSQWSCRALATCKLVWHGRSS